MIIGRFGKPYGLLGFIYLRSFTEPAENIFSLLPWYIKKNEAQLEIVLEQQQVHNKNIVVKLAGCNDRNAASAYTNIFIHIERHQLPWLKKNEYYWVDLEGLTVINKENIVLGTVEYLFATPANDVMKVDQHLIPYIKDVILHVDLKQKTILVDWQIN